MKKSRLEGSSLESNQDYNKDKPVIWYLHHYAGSPSLGMAFRPYYLSHEFNKHGFSSFIIASSFHHLKRNIANQEKSFEPQTVDGEQFIWLRTPSYKGNGFGRIKNMFAYAWGLWRNRIKLVEETGKPSIIIVSSGHPFHYIPAFLIKKKYNAKIIFEVRDLWPLSFVELLGLSPYHPFVLLLSLIEKIAYRTADEVVSVLPNALTYMKKNGLNDQKYHYISNGVSVSHSLYQRAFLPEHLHNLIEKQKQAGFFIIGYAGSHGVPNALDDLIQAMIILKKEGYNLISLILVGQGQEKKKLDALAQHNQLDTVVFLDTIQNNQVMSFLDHVDLLYIGWKNKPIYRFGISPNKIFEYMMAGKPILQAISSPYDLISEIGCGITVDAENPEAIAAAIKQLSVYKKEELLKMGQLGAQALSEKYTYDRLAQKYMALF